MWLFIALFDYHAGLIRNNTLIAHSVNKISSKYVTKSVGVLWLFRYFIINLTKSMFLNVPNGQIYELGGLST